MATRRHSHYTEKNQCVKTEKTCIQSSETYRLSGVKVERRCTIKQTVQTTVVKDQCSNQVVRSNARPVMKSNARPVVKLITPSKHKCGH